MLLCIVQFLGYAQHFVLQPTIRSQAAPFQLAGYFWMFLFAAALNIPGLIVT